jgi:hypothetical protein
MKGDSCPLCGEGQSAVSIISNSERGDSELLFGIAKNSLGSRCPELCTECHWTTSIWRIRTLINGWRDQHV